MATAAEIEAEEAALVARDAATPESWLDMVLRWPDEPTPPEPELLAKVSSNLISSFVEVWPGLTGGWFVRVDGEDHSPVVPTFEAACQLARIAASSVFLIEIAHAKKPESGQS